MCSIWRFFSQQKNSVHSMLSIGSFFSRKILSIRCFRFFSKRKKVDAPKIASDVFAGGEGNFLVENRGKCCPFLSKSNSVHSMCSIWRFFVQKNWSVWCFGFSWGKTQITKIDSANQNLAKIGQHFVLVWHQISKHRIGQLFFSGKFRQHFVLF